MRAHCNPRPTDPPLTFCPRAGVDALNNILLIGMTNRRAGGGGQALCRRWTGHGSPCRSVPPAAAAAAACVQRVRHARETFEFFPGQT